MEGIVSQQQQQQPSASSSVVDDWTLVLSDFRRSVSNLVLFMLESIPMPWVFPQQQQQQQQPLYYGSSGDEGRCSYDEERMAPPAPKQPAVTDAELEEWFLPPLPTTTPASKPKTTAQAPFPASAAVLLPPAAPATAAPKPKRAPRKKAPAAAVAGPPSLMGSVEAFV